MELRRRNLLLSSLLVLGMFSLLGLSCSLRSQPYSGPSDAPKLYVGGDSITNLATDDINAQFQPTYQVRIDGWGGGDSVQMASRVEAAAASSPDVAIIELGTNDPAFPHNMPLAESEQTLESLTAAFAASTCVIFVTPWSGTVSRPPGTLAAIDGFERSTFPHLADWDAAVGPDDYADTDMVHPNPTGNLHLMQVEAAAIASCPPPVTTTTTTSTDTTTSSTDPTTTDTTPPSTDTTTSSTDPTTSSTDPTTTDTTPPSTDATSSSTDTTP